MTDLAQTPAPLLSICMIVKNEEDNLARALESATGIGAEIVVVDTGSSDRTVDVARRAGARVEHFAWVDDFSAARNFALASARGVWLFVLDADEELTEELRTRIRGVLETSRAGALRIPAASVDERGVLQMQTPTTRIIRSGRGYVYEGRVHERIEMSIARAGDSIEDAELPIVHHGYTSQEDARKQRHERNMALVMREHEACPDDPRHWHYLGLQHAIAGDHERAGRWFERVVSEHPEHELAGWSASQLAAIRTAERALGAAWEAARFGTRTSLGRVSSLLTLGEIALRDGDARAALECAASLDKLPDEPLGDCGRRRERSIIVHARAAEALGNSRAAYTSLVRAVRKQPEDAGLADELVKMAERIDTTSRASVTAVKDAQGARSVIAAGIGTYVRRRAWQEAVQLGERHTVSNEYLALALLRVGRVDEARALLTEFGHDSATHLLLLGFDIDDAASVTRALTWLPARAAIAAEHVLGRRRVPHELGWLITAWMELAVAFRADSVAERLALALPHRPSESAAMSALFRYEGGEPMVALSAALACADEPDALEVIGLVAHDKGDMAASAVMLSRRARAGDVSVRVVLKGCAALRATGKRAAADQLLELGRASRPHSPSLAR